MTQSTLSAALFVILGVGGSTHQVRAVTPSEVANAQADGTKTVAAATMPDDQRVVITKAENQAARDSAEAAYKVAIVNSNAIHKAAIERCKDFTGAARKDCTKSADDEFETEKAQADAERIS